MSDLLENEIKDRLPTKSLVKKGPNYYEADDGRKLFTKSNSTLNARVMLIGEMESLREIEATKTIRVPKQYFVLPDYDTKNHKSALLLEYLELQSIDNDAARILGKRLADLHEYNKKVLRFSRTASKWIGHTTPSVKLLKQNRDLNEDFNNTNDESGSDKNQSEDEYEDSAYTKHQLRFKSIESVQPKKYESAEYSERFIPELDASEPIEEFGFKVATACGVLPQVNHWTSNWVEFFARYRLEQPINTVLSEHGDRELIEKWSYFQLRVDKFFTDFDKDADETIIPALLHGDLWSGNIGQIIEEEQSIPVVYDPSSFYGHSEYDFGIARMFGGIPKSFESAYFEIIPKKKLFEKRNKLYQLFHHLNHWNHFGFGYRASSLRLLDELNKI